MVPFGDAMQQHSEAAVRLQRVWRTRFSKSTAREYAKDMIRTGLLTTNMMTLRYFSRLLLRLD